MSFAELKKNRKERLANLHDALSSASKTPKKDKYVDDRFWKLTCKDDEGKATIRFLTPKGDLEYTQYYDHGIKGKLDPKTGRPQWYIEKSLSSIGQKDPVSEYYFMLWNGGQEERAREIKRRLHYVANILVVKDEANPENEGKVFLFEFGTQIFKMIQEAYEPPFDEEGRKVGDDEYAPESRLDVFSLWSGANFMLNATKKSSGFRTYEGSRFLKVSPVAKTDDDMEGIYEQTHDLSDFLDPKNFKTYDELEARFRKVYLGEDGENDKTESAPSSSRQESAPQQKSSASFDDSDDDVDLDALISELED
jgi:hypothetical protein